MKKIFDLIISFRLSLVKILFYELFYIISGFKGNNFNIRGDRKSSDNIPCSYYFLSKIYKQIKDIDFKSFVDLGCGHGRVLFFFSKKIYSNYLGVELFENSYQSSLKTLKGIPNVKVINVNFFDIVAALIVSVMLVFITANKLYNKSAGIVLLTVLALVISNSF